MRFSLTYKIGYSQSAINSASVNDHSVNDLETATRRLSKRAMPIQPVKLNSRLKYSAEVSPYRYLQQKGVQSENLLSSAGKIT